MKKRFYKTENNRVLFGVCGGLGEYFNVDPTLIRLVWALSIFVWGFGFWLYFICAFVMPCKSNIK